MCDQASRGNYVEIAKSAGRARARASMVHVQMHALVYPPDAVSLGPICMSVTGAILRVSAVSLPVH